MFNRFFHNLLTISITFYAQPEKADRKFWCINQYKFIIKYLEFAKSFARVTGAVHFVFI